MSGTPMMRRTYSIRQVCELIGVCHTTVYQHIHSGELVARKAGGKTLILAEDLERFLQSLPVLKLDGGEKASNETS